MNTIQSICSQAMVKIGGLPISSMSDNSTEAIVANTLYQSTVDSLLSSYNWTFARTELSSQSSEINEITGYYTHNMPSDILRLINIFSSNYKIINSYKILSKKIIIHNPSIIFFYIKNINESIFPAYFIEYLVSKLAAEFCLPITENTTRADFLYRIADRLEKIARSIDGQQSSPMALDGFPLIEVRE